MWDMFDELISTKKHYYSYFKRNVDFINFDSSFGKMWLEENTYFEDSTMKSMYDLTVTKIKDQKHYNAGYAFNTVTNSFISVGKNKRSFFYQSVEQQINDYLATEKGKKLNILHCIIRPCEFSLGCYNIGSPLYLWDKDDKARSVEMVSICDELLNQQKASYVPFHLYFLPMHYKDSTRMPNFEELENIVLKVFIEELKKIKIQQKNDSSLLTC